MRHADCGSKNVATGRAVARLLDGESIELARVDRIEMGLEGAWTQTATVVWTRGDGLRGFDELPRDPTRRPVLELMLPDGWVGVHCHVHDERGYSLDERRARAIIDEVAAADAAESR